MNTLTHHAERLITEELEVHCLETRHFLGMVKAGRPVHEAVKVLHPDCTSEVLALTSIALDEGVSGEDLRTVIMNTSHRCF
ncbi:MAG: hypothetical protein ACE366_07115 [Bradymonadia bacterium]